MKKRIERSGVLKSLVAAFFLAAGPLAVHVVKADGAPDAGALTYAGELTDANGVPLPSPQDIELALWDSASSGNQECASAFPGTILDEAGRFELTLPDACAEAVRATPDLWIEVTVGESLLGRIKLGAVPYALEAANAASLEGQPAAAFQRRVDATGCAPGASISAISEDGSVTCQTDGDTTYQAGSGLTLSETTFAVGPPTLEPVSGYPLTSPIDGFADHVTSATYAFCSLSYVRYPADAAGTTHWCTVSPNANGTWTLQANGSGEPARCGMVCF